ERSENAFVVNVARFTDDLAAVIYGDGVGVEIRRVDRGEDALVVNIALSVTCAIGVESSDLAAGVNGVALGRASARHTDGGVGAIVIDEAVKAGAGTIFIVSDHLSAVINGGG